jgi:hypothetical protein
MSPARNADDYQIGGTHYKDLAHEPNHLTVSYDLGGLEHSIVKYVTRWRSKGGIDDLRKALHFAEKLIESAGRLEVVRGERPEATALPLLASDYVTDNRMDAKEALVVLYICRWSQSRNRRFIEPARLLLLDLIHDERPQVPGMAIDVRA